MMDLFMFGVSSTIGAKLSQVVLIGHVTTASYWLLLIHKMVPNSGVWFD